MRILIINAVYPPETGGGATHIYETVKGLQRLNHRVTVLAGSPCYPSGIVSPEYRGKLLKRQADESAQVFRCYQFIRPARTPKVQMLNELSLMITTTIFGAFLPRPDVVLAISPPFFLGITGWILSRIKRVPFAFDVRDIYPDLPIEVGIFTNSLVIRILRFIERFLYSRARLVVTTTPSQVEKIRARTDRPNKVRLIPNGVNVDTFKKLPVKTHPIWDKHALYDKFVVVVTGCIGRSHDLQNLIHASKHLEQHPNITILFIGEGTQKQPLIKLAEELNLKNVLFEDSQPAGEIPAILSLADAGVSSLIDIDFGHDSMPIKLGEYMACRLPVILCARGEMERLVRRADSGIIVPPEQPEALARAIIRLSTDGEEAARLGRNGREFVTKELSREKLAADLEKYLLEIARREAEAFDEKNPVPDQPH